MDNGDNNIDPQNSADADRCFKYARQFVAEGIKSGIEPHIMMTTAITSFVLLAGMVMSDENFKRVSDEVPDTMRKLFPVCREYWDALTAAAEEK